MEIECLNKTSDSVEYVFPGLELLDNYSEEKHDVSDEEVRRICDDIRTILSLSRYKLKAAKIEVVKGSVLTQYKILSGKIGVRKADWIAEDLQNFIDWKLYIMAAKKGMISMGIPNRNPLKIPLKDILKSNDFLNTDYELPIAVGVDVSEKFKVIDLADAPHILVGGATGQGKTVFLKTAITSLLYAKRPNELKLVLIDPRTSEYNIYSKLSGSYLLELQSGEVQSETLVPRVQKNLSGMEICYVNQELIPNECKELTWMILKFYG